jgi:serine/threonine-protein kinase HipA
MSLLHVYLHGKLAGNLVQGEGGRLSFRYAPEYLQEENPPLSQRLPLEKQEFDDRTCRALFSGLLPDGEERTRVGKLLQVSEKNTFRLLEILGGECAGAISFYPEGHGPEEEKPHYRELREKDLEEMLLLLAKRPLLAGTEGVRLSLAGAQRKLAVAKLESNLALPLGSALSTHILKPAIPGFEDSTENEHFSLRLAARLGLESVETEVRTAGSQKFLLVKRFDRTEEGGALRRLHQEDACQALGIPPERKYESEGGPGFRQLFLLLEDASQQPAADKIELFRTSVFNFILGNADAHGKNFSLLYAKGRKPTLAPRYDLLCTLAYDGLSERMAMRIGGKRSFDDVFLRHFLKLADEGNLSAKLARLKLEEIRDSFLDAAAQLAGELELPRKTWQLMHKGFESRVKQLTL